MSRLANTVRGGLRAALFTFLTALSLATPAIAQTCQPAWDNGFDLVLTPPAVGDPGLVGDPGMSNGAFATTIFDDGTGPALYAGGEFTTAGGVAASNIAKWDGVAWSALGAGVDGGATFTRVFALTVFDDGTGPSLYAGGEFTTAGGVSASNIAKWDGVAWSALGAGVDGGATFTRIFALTVFDDGTGPALYAGGRFTAAGGVSVNFIAKWDGSSWSPLGSGMHGETISDVNALAVFDDGTGPALYAGGGFSTAGGVSANRIAKWDGSTWSPLGSGTNGSVLALTVFDDGTGPALYAGGFFTTAGGVSASNIAKWNGSSWTPLGGGVFGGSFPIVIALAVFDDGTGPALYAGGGFTDTDDVPANRIAKWDGSSWTPLGSGVSNGMGIAALTVFDDGSGLALYAGGDFTTAGSLPASHIAKWDGSTWAVVSGVGANNSISELKILTINNVTSLFGIGSFTRTGAALSNSIASFDGQQWQSLGGGVDTGGSVNDLAIFDDGTGEALYAGGLFSFSTAGGVLANFIAKWDGSSWSPLGSGMNSDVLALTVFDDGTGPALYAGGIFTAAGGVSASHIAKWDGSSWTPLGSGMDGSVVALSVFDDGTGPALYASGFFTAAGGLPASNIAKWDGKSWTPLGSGVSNGVFATTIFDDGTGPALYAGGFFTTAGGVSASNIAKWNGVAWSALGAGVDGTVTALKVLDGANGLGLWVRGSFLNADGQPAGGIARWNGSTWDSMNGGTNSFNAVKDLVVFDDGMGPAVYAGGSFTTAGGVSANRIAKWDGTSWSPLDLGIDGGNSNTVVNALAVFDGPTGPALYAGGSFDSSGGLPASNFARWNGCAALNPADLNGDGVVNAVDLETLLAQWGPCPPPPSVCAADLNANGIVDGVDLATLLTNWGL